MSYQYIYRQCTVSFTDDIPNMICRMNHDKDNAQRRLLTTLKVIVMEKEKWLKTWREQHRATPQKVPDKVTVPCLIYTHILYIALAHKWLYDQKPDLFTHNLKFILLPQLIVTTYAWSLPPLANVDWSAFPECFLLTM